MNRDDILRMAHEAGMVPHRPFTLAHLRDFTALVAAAERERAIGIAKGMQEELQAKFEQTYMEGVIAGAAAEREACAIAGGAAADAGRDVAAAIRARGKT